MAVRSVRVRSLAKINLDLRVLHRRTDGYHELRTVFQTVSLSDTIEIEYAPAISTEIRVFSSLDIPEKDNLIYKAAEAVFALSKSAGQVTFRLIKKIPAGGGLGGGSSNAAAVLLALPALTGRPAPLPALLEVAATLGSDVPFFLFGGAALGLGRGTELYPAPEPVAGPVLLIAPGLHLSTVAAYRELGRERAPEADSPSLAGFQSLAWSLAERTPFTPVNDFETVVFRQHPQLELMKGKLREMGAEPALMSGSGSSLFGVFENRLARDRATVCLQAEFGSEKAIPVQFVSRSRYRALWRRQLRDHIQGKQWPPRSRHEP